MELLQSQAPAEGELLGPSAVRTSDIGHWTFGHLDIWTFGHLDIRH